MAALFQNRRFQDQNLEDFLETLFLDICLLLNFFSIFILLYCKICLNTSRGVFKNPYIGHI